MKQRMLTVSTALLLASAAFAQSKQITGVVTDANNEPLIGVTVQVKGNTSLGAVTDMDGRYQLNVPGDKSELVFSYIGYGQQQISVGTQHTINVVLRDDARALDEVVVIGYGSVKRRDLTGAVASVTGDDVKANPVSNVAQALQGKLPGVNVISGDGRPGGNISVRVRGGGSITQSNEPLYVVDGFPVSSIDNLPASEIESIDVLKDASSTAIYGARGANGVILVTTKGAKEGRVKVAYDGYVQTKSAMKTQETLSAQEYVLHNWSYATSRGQANGDAVAKYFGLGSQYGNHYADYANVATHDYTDDLLRSALTHSHNVSVSGGSDRTKIVANLGYINDEGVKICSDYERLSASLKLSQQITHNLNLDMDVRYNESTLNGSEGVTNGKGSNVSGAYRYRPIDNPLGGVDFSDVASGFSFGVANIDDSHNPVELVHDVVDQSYNRSMRGSAALTWQIISGLTARTELSINRGTSKRTYYVGGYNGDKQASLTRATSKGLRSVTTLNYQFDLGKDHAFNLLAGHELINSESESSTLNGRGYPDTFDFDRTIGMIQTATVSSSFSNTIGVPNRTVSFFGRVNYTLMDRYLFTATFRADGSSKFGPDNRWGYFPAAAIAWRINDEPFMKGTENWLSNLKLRLSLGTSGTDNISSNLWRETWSSQGSGSNHYPINGITTAFYRPDGLLANNNLKWETTISRNLGIDFGLWNQRLNGSIEVYWNTTKDLLMAVPVDNTTGYSHQFQNFGRTSNRGFELSLNYDVVNKGDFRFNIGAIYNYNRNRLDELKNADQYLYSSNWASSALVPRQDYMLVEGSSIGVVRGFISEGFYTPDDFTYANGVYTLKPGVADLTKAVTATYMHPFQLADGQTAFPGAPKYKDVNGDGMVNLDDVTSLGEVQARNTGSFSLNFGYKNWDLSANFNWVAGGQIYNVAAMINASGQEYDGIGAQRASWLRDAYKVYNVDNSGNLYAVTDPAELARLNASASHPLPYHQSGITSSEWLEDGSYLRLQTLTLGYTFDRNLTKKIGISSARLYFTATNLFTITGYSGIDPEVNSYTAGSTGFLSGLRIFPTLNMDFGSYPRSRTFTLGANITF